jgi:hypothetical protein
MSSYTEGQTHQLMDALEVAGFSPAEVTQLGQLGNLRLNELRLVLKGGAKIVPAESKQEVEEILDFNIHVDRSVKPTYPDWVKKILHPELESSGPTDYDLATVEQWLHDGQKDARYVKGQVIYDYLKSNPAEFARQHSLRDLEEIQKKGIKVFRKLYGGKAVFAWKSVVRDRSGFLSVSYLYEHDSGVVLGWLWLEDVWSGSNPGLRFAK